MNDQRESKKKKEDNPARSKPYYMEESVKNDDVNPGSKEAPEPQKDSSTKK